MNSRNFSSKLKKSLDLEDLALWYIKKKNGIFKKGQGIPIKKTDVDILKLEKSYEMHERFMRKFSLRKKDRILEIGSGFGGFIVASNMDGTNCWGIEPDKEMVSVAKKLMKSLQLDQRKVLAGSAEKLPFKSNCFHYVVSFQVLEHVESPAKTLAEAIRVLKPGGTLYFVVPNYNSFYEGHIKKMWFPFINKQNASFYLKFIGAPANSLNYIQFITPEWLRKIIKEIPSASIVSFGEDEFVKNNFQLKMLSKIKNPYLRNLIKPIFLMRIHRLVARILVYFEWYYPLEIVLQKK